MSVPIAVANADQGELRAQHSELRGCDRIGTPVVPDLEHTQVPNTAIPDQRRNDLALRIARQERCECAFTNTQHDTCLIGRSIGNPLTRPEHVDLESPDSECRACCNLAHSLGPDHGARHPQSF